MKKILIILAICGIFSCEDIPTIDLDEFDSNMAAWKALGIDAYRFTAISYYDACPTEPITVTVLPGREPELTYDQERINDNPEYIYYISEGYPFIPYKGITIDELFDSLRKSIISSHKNTIITIRYNKDFFYPESFFSESVGKTGSGKIVHGKGGQSSLEIRSFEILDVNDNE